MLFRSVLPFVLVLRSLSATGYSTGETIDWFPCKENGSLPLTCGTLTVPLDYTNTTFNATLELQLVKVSAAKQPKRGSILFNPGGPGQGGRDFVAGINAPALLVATGGAYDLIGFDTRGTSTTLPFSCYTSPVTRAVANLSFSRVLNASDTTVGDIWAAAQALGESCYENARDVGELIGTGFVARDIMQIVDALDEDGLLRYWGLSYGTVLGATVAAMFPDRMDKLVLDGCLNPHNYYAGNDLEGGTDSDAVFDGFFAGCIAHPETCDLAQDADTAEELKAKFYDLLFTLKYEPIVAGSGESALIFNYATIKSAVQYAMYGPTSWPTLATGLHGLMTGNKTAILALTPLLNIEQETIFPDNGPEAIYGIRASDASLRTTNLTSLFPLLEQFYAKSQLMGDIISAPALAYAQWPFKAKGTYTGNFQAKTKNPLLFVGNDFDIVTPLVSAYNASAGFEGSVVLQHGGYGHTSSAQPSLCTVKAIRAYFVNGTLPNPGTRCEPSYELFSNITLEQAFAEIFSQLE
ncbi:MAG: hypothetical protein Q9188_003819 [Gyalolechia gomerana]